MAWLMATRSVASTIKTPKQRINKHYLIKICEAEKCGELLSLISFAIKNNCGRQCCAAVLTSKRDSGVKEDTLLTTQSLT